MKYTLLILTGLAALTGCNIGRHLPRGEKLFTGSQINMHTDSGSVKNELAALQTGLTDMARPKPNAQILGFPWKVAFYYFVGEPRKPKGLRSFLRKKLGEAPVLASARTLTSNAALFTNYVETEGYFGSTVQGSFAESGYKAKAVYDVQVQPRFYINSVTFLSDSTPLGKALVASSRRTVLKVGDPFRYNNITVEQERVSQALKQRGFYYFVPDYVTFIAANDSVTHRTKMYVAIKPETPDDARARYNIRNVYVYPNFSLNGGTAARDTNERLAYTSFNGLRIVDSSRTFDPKLFRDVISVLPGRRYSSRAQDITLSRLINVGTFKFVRNRFDTVEQADSNLLDVHYYLTPYPRKALQLSLAGTSKSNNYTGTNLVFTQRNRNLFGRAELLQFNLNAGIEAQIGGGQSPLSYRYGADVTLSLPRLLSPVRINYDQRSILPKTNITLGYSLIVRRQFYSLSSFQASLGYAFKTSPQVEVSIQPLTVTYVKPFGYGTLFRDSLLLSPNPDIQNQALRIFDSEQLILGTVISYNYNSSPRTNSPYSTRFAANLDFAGNVAGLLVKQRDAFGAKAILGTSFAQYVRLDLDSRHYYRVTPNLTWASRLYAGFGLPYGNNSGGDGSSPTLPIVKQFFVGGSNSIRAFRPRAIGPGSYARGNGTSALYFQDGGGDIKLEGNTELRQKFGKYLQGALFFDVGNVWMYADTLSYGAGSKFSSQFAKQLAVGTGVGLRLDLSYFVVRFDLAFPLRRPNLPDGQRWVFNQIAFGQKQWRRDNLVLNIAIGYPF